MKIIVKVFLFLIISLINYVVLAQWNGLGNGANSSVLCFDINNDNKLIIGGSFRFADGQSMNCIGIWDSLSWISVGNNDSFNGSIRCVKAFNGGIVVGGNFDSIGNQSINRIAFWDGITWNQMGDGFNNYVNDLIVYNNNLYAGGAFTTSGTTAVRKLSKWDGSNWIPVSNFGSGEIIKLNQFQNKLIATGIFSSIDGDTSYSGIGSFDGATWSNLGIIFDNRVYGSSSIGDTLVVYGPFQNSIPATSQYVCGFDGVNWLPFPSPHVGLSGTSQVLDVIQFNSRIFYCGNFTNPEDIAYINGNYLDSIGVADGSVFKMYVYKNQLYFGGLFSTIGGVNTTCVARYNDFISTFSNDLIFNQKTLVYPNPIDVDKSNILNIKSENEIMNIKLFTINGKKANISLKKIDINNFQAELPLNKGIYILSIQLPHFYIVNTKIIIL